MLTWEEKSLRWQIIERSAQHRLKKTHQEQFRVPITEIFSIDVSLPQKVHYGTRCLWGKKMKNEWLVIFADNSNFMHGMNLVDFLSEKSSCCKTNSCGKEFWALAPALLRSSPWRLAWEKVHTLQGFDRNIHSATSGDLILSGSATVCSRSH